MTLDIPKFIKKTIEKQMTIQHYDAIVKVFRKISLPTNIVQKIQQQFGDTYLEDSNFIIFYKGRINKKGLKKLFNITDKALGEDANRLTEGDFKIFKLNDGDDTSEFASNSEASGEADVEDDQSSATSDTSTSSDSQAASDEQAVDTEEQPNEQPSFDMEASSDGQTSASDSDAASDDKGGEEDSADLDKEISDEISHNDDSSSDEDSKAVDDDIAAVDDEEQLDKEIANEVNKDDNVNEDEVVDETIPVRFFFLKITTKQ